MTIQNLQENLRAHIRSRIQRGELTGVALAQQAGVRQSHLSNFLNARRGLSLESIDRLLAGLRLEVLDLVPVDAMERRVRLPREADRLPVAVVSGRQGVGLARFTLEQVRETVKFPKAFLRRLRKRDACRRGDWVRFVVVALDAASARSLWPASAGGARILVDRCYTSLRPYRPPRPNLYAVWLRSGCMVGQLTVAGGHLIVRPRNPDLPVESLPMGLAHGFSDYVIGRVCHFAAEV